MSRMKRSDVQIPFSDSPIVSEDHRAALFASFLGWTLDAFDFFLVGLSLSAIAATFHKTNADIALSIAVTLGFSFVKGDRKSTRLNSSHTVISYAVFCLKK